jgi:BMFP domain-containing protein YqiC
MQTNNRILDDIAKVANGAVSTLVGVKSEAESAVRQTLSNLLSEFDFVTRDEFEAIKAVAVKARKEQEKQEKRIDALEAAMAYQVKTKTKPSITKD